MTEWIDLYSKYLKGANLRTQLKYQLGSAEEFRHYTHHSILHLSCPIWSF